MNEIQGDLSADALRALIAVGVVAGDLSPEAIARYARVHQSVAERAAEWAVSTGLVGPDGRVSDPVAAELVATLPDARVAEIHAVVARTLMAAGGARAAEAVVHARAAGAVIPPGEMIELAVHSGLVALSMSDWDAAEVLFRLVTDLDLLTDRPVDTVHLRFHGVALTALGRFAEAHTVLVRAADEAIRNDDWHEATSAIGQLVVPIEWNYSDKTALGLLERVSRMDLDAQTRIVLDALRSMVESWIPLKVEGSQQFAWVSRSSLAQPMADRALRDAVDVEPKTRLIALTAWRATHRAPQFLVRRRSVSAEALDVAQVLRYGYFQIEAAVAQAVDALESGDRAGYDEGMTVARWVAEQQDSRWLTWRAHTLLAGAAHLDGDLVAARHHRESAFAIGSEFGISGTVATNTFLLVEEVLDRDDPEEMAAFHVADDEPAVAHALGRLALAYREARVGQPESAERSLRIALRQIDAEGSYLLTACRAVAVLVALRDGDAHGAIPDSVTDVADSLITILEPWSRHVAVDSYGLWCGGPVSLALAELNEIRGNAARAAVLLSFASRTARSTSDVRALARVERLGRRLVDGPDVDPAVGYGLTDRELLVLRGIAAGRTNQAIANDLAFSLSTIRNDTTEIFRKLGVPGRRAAAAKARDVGLVEGA